MQVEHEVVWNGTMGRNYQPHVDISRVESLEPLPPKDPHECCWLLERQKVLKLLGDYQPRRIKAIGYELGIPQRALHGFIQRWKRHGIVVSDPSQYGAIRLVKVEPMNDYRTFESENNIIYAAANHIRKGEAVKINIPDVPRDEQDALCWKQEVNAYGNITTFVRCTKPKGHDAPDGWDRLHSWDKMVDPVNQSRF